MKYIEMIHNVRLGEVAYRPNDKNMQVCRIGNTIYRKYPTGNVIFLATAGEVFAEDWEILRTNKVVVIDPNNPKNLNTEAKPFYKMNQRQESCYVV